MGDEEYRDRDGGFLDRIRDAVTGGDRDRELRYDDDDERRHRDRDDDDERRHRDRDDDDE
jgi:hypothetical protein